MTPKEAEFFKGYIDWQLNRIFSHKTSEEVSGLFASTFADRYMATITGQQLLPQTTFRQFLEEFDGFTKELTDLVEKFNSFSYDADTKTLSIYNAESPDALCVKIVVTDGGVEILRVAEGKSYGIVVTTDLDALEYNKALRNGMVATPTDREKTPTLITNKTDDTLEDNEVILLVRPKSNGEEIDYEVGGAISMSDRLLVPLNKRSYIIISVEDITYGDSVGWKLRLVNPLDYGASPVAVIPKGIIQLVTSLTYIAPATTTTLATLSAGGDCTLNADLEVQNLNVGGEVKTGGIIANRFIGKAFHKLDGRLDTETLTLGQNAAIAIENFEKEPQKIKLKIPDSLIEEDYCLESDLLVNNYNGESFEFISDDGEIVFAETPPLTSDLVIYHFVYFPNNDVVNNAYIIGTFNVINQ